MLCARDRETWQVLVSLWCCWSCYIQRQGDLASPCIFVVLLVMLYTEAGRPGKSLYLCGVVGHGIYRGRETWQVLVSLWCCWSCYLQRQGDLASPCIFVVLLVMVSTEAGRPGKSLYLCGVAGHAVYRRLAGKSLLFYGGRGHISTEAGRPGKSSLFCDVVGNVVIQKQGDLACPCYVVV